MTTNATKNSKSEVLASVVRVVRKIKINCHSNHYGVAIWNEICTVKLIVIIYMSRIHHLTSGGVDLRWKYFLNSR
jgi:hypothetical protein